MGIVKSGETFAAKNAKAVSRISEVLHDARRDGVLATVDRTAEAFLKENSVHIYVISPELEEDMIKVNFYFPKPKNYNNSVVKSLQFSGTFTDANAVAKHSLALLARVNEAIKTPAEPIKEAQRSQ
ncbi:MAG: hypothetical protein KGH78_03255 [Candidatus Micrarchaeota archaeon]|nr:hypothetical protein [Candidatus Micrarchaeota archaeon]